MSNHKEYVSNKKNVPTFSYHFNPSCSWVAVNFGYDPSVPSIHPTKLQHKATKAHLCCIFQLLLTCIYRGANSISDGIFLSSFYLVFFFFFNTFGTGGCFDRTIKLCTDLHSFLSFSYYFCFFFL